MLKILWASNDFKLSLFSSIFCAGFAFYAWYSLREDFLLGLGLGFGVFPPLNLALKIIIEYQLKTRRASKLTSSLLVRAWEFVATFGTLVIVMQLSFPEVLQETEIVIFFLGLGIFCGLAVFQAKWKELKRQAIAEPTKSPSPPAP